MKILALLFSVFYQKTNGDCECLSNVCNDCSATIDGLSCNDDFICEVYSLC